MRKSDIAMRLLITGGAGCLGSNLVERYLPQGHDILIIDNFATGSKDVLPGHMEGLAIVEGTIADQNLVDECFSDFHPTHVIHSAASYKDPDDWREDAATNIVGTINIVRACEQADVNRLIHFQTALCYGRPETVPIPIDAPLRPFTSYGISKTAAEAYVLQSSVPALSLRLANVTGPRLAIGPIPTFYKRLKAGQSCFCSDTVRDFLDMEDFFSIVDNVLEEGAPNGAYNVSTGEGKTIKDIFDAVVSYLGLTLDVEVPIVPAGDDDVPAVVLDPSQTEKILGWRAKIGFEDTIQRMLEWYDAHGVSAVYSHLKAPVSETSDDQ